MCVSRHADLEHSALALYTFHMEERYEKNEKMVGDHADAADRKRFSGFYGDSTRQFRDF